MPLTHVPRDFPQEFLGTVSGAQPKLLVLKNERGEYVSVADIDAQNAGNSAQTFASSSSTM
jgi:hypothetical protein